MIMSDAERMSLIGEGNPKMSKGPLTFADGSPVDMSRDGYPDPNEADIRNWLKGIRDSGYVCTFLTFRMCLATLPVNIIQYLLSDLYEHYQLANEIQIFQV